MILVPHACSLSYLAGQDYSLDGLDVKHQFPDDLYNRHNTSNGFQGPFKTLEDDSTSSQDLP